MGTGTTRRKRTHKNHKQLRKKYRTRRREKDLDQIKVDLEPRNADALLHSPIDQDVPGGGQHYCITCARYFIGDLVLKRHLKSKPHKRRLRVLQDPAYTQHEAENAAGQGCYVLSPALND